MDISIIIPIYNEVDNIPKLQHELAPVINYLAIENSVELVFVDDGSTDGTLQALIEAFSALFPRKVAVRFRHHESNRGLGAALCTGFSAASGDLLVTTDSDGTYSFTEIPSLLSSLKPNLDMVTASPYHPSGGIAGVPAYRLALSKGASLIYRMLVDWNVHTYTALFRVYRRCFIEDTSFESIGFVGQTELMVRGMLLGHKVGEYPAVLHRREYGVSKSKLLRTIFAHLRLQWRVILHRLNLLPLVKMHEVIGG